VLTEKGYVDPAALDLLIETYETKVGPRKRRARGRQSMGRCGLPRAPIQGFDGGDRRARLCRRQGEHNRRAGEYAANCHNMVVCTLCSCYPWPVLGLPPVWYKSAPYRSRAVADPRSVLADFGVYAAEGHRYPRLGFDRRGPLSRHPDAPDGTGGLERGQACRSGDAAIA